MLYISITVIYIGGTYYIGLTPNHGKRAEVEFVAKKLKLLCENAKDLDNDE